jgi:hypothetical protein
MRNVSTQMADEFSGAVVQPVFLLEALFDSGPLRLWTGVGDLEFNGNTYTGAGNFLGLSAIEETQDLQAKGLVVSLTGVPLSLVSLALSEGSKIRGRPFRSYLGAFDTRRKIGLEDETGAILQEDGGYILLESQLVDTPYRWFSGLMDTMEFTVNGSTCDIRLSVENILIYGQKPKIYRYTDEEQKRRYPGDRGLEFINQLQDKEIVW